MLQIACWYEAAPSPTTVGEYLSKLGVRHVICDARHVAEPDRPKEIALHRLRQFKQQLAADGAELAAVTVGWVRAETLDPEAGRAQRELILRNIRTLGEGGVAVAQLFIMVKADGDEQIRKQQWRRMVEYCKEVATTAQQAGVKVGVHGSQDRDHLLTDLPSYQRLLSDVPQPALGLTLCLGCLTICGSDAAACVRELGSRTVFLHARDLVLKADGSWTDVNLGEGQIDYAAIQQAVRELNLSIPIQPEHLGKISFEQHEEVTMARALGFLKGLFDPAPRHPAART